jgi:predicted PurR-regulated permease PerM
VWIPAAIFLALEGSWEKALVLAAWGAIAVGLIDNLLYPTLVSRKLRLHTLPVFVAILGGVLTFGATGLVLGPLLLALAAELLALWQQPAPADSTAGLEEPVEGEPAHARGVAGR